MNESEKKKASQQLDHWKTGVGKPSPYMGSWDLPGDFQNVQLTIKEAKKEVTTGLKDNKTAVILYFNEPVKPMIMNATNSKVLRALTGSPYIQKWAGYRIELRVEKGIKAFGSIHDTLRIVNKKIVATKIVLTEDHPKYEEIKLKLASGTKRSVVEKYYDLSKSGL